MAIGDEKVTIRIDVKANTAEIDRVRQKLKQLCREADDCADTFERLSGALDDSGDGQREFGKQTGDNDRKLKSLNRTAKGFAKFMSTTFKLAMMGSAIETGLLMIALSSVNGLLGVGRFLVKSYHVAMSAMAKAAAAAGVALATVAAAQRQYAAAMSSGRYGGNFALASRGLRTMTGDARLATLGIKSLTGAFQVASKNAKVTGVTTSAIAGLMDFATLTGDLEKGTAAVANLVSLIQKGGAGGAGVADAAKELGPEFEKAFKEVSRGGKATANDLMKAFSSGELAKKAGIAGAYANVQGTLLGQLKAFATEMQVMFGDLGQRFITPMQQAFAKIRVSLVETMTKLMPILDEFGRGKMIDALVRGVDKIGDFLVTMMREYVPRTEGFFKSMSNFWNKLVSGFQKFGKYLNQFKESSKVMNQFFGKILGAFGRGIKKNFEGFADGVLENKDDFLKFGDSIANLVTSIMDLFKAFRDAFFKALPVITRIVNVISGLVDAISKLIRGLSSLGPVGGFLGYFGPILAMMGAGKLMKMGPAGRANLGGKAKGAYNFISNNPGLLAIPGALTLNALTNQGNTAVESIGDVASASLLGAGLGYSATGLLTKGAGAAFNAGAALQAGGGKMAAAGGRLATGAMGAASMTGAQMAGAGAILAGGMAATHVGSNLASDAVYRGTGGNRFLATGTGALAGAATGAATGAALTAWLGPGAAVGAVVGAVIGAIWGGINGFMKDSKYKKQAKEAANKFVDNYAKIVEKAFAGNNIAVVREAMRDFDKYAQQMADGQVKSGTAMTEAQKLWAEEAKVFEPTAKLMESRFSDLTRISGLTEQQIMELANTAEIDLGNGLIDLQDILAATGIAVLRVGEDFKKAFTDVYAQGVGKIGTAAEALQAPIVINETAEMLREQAIAQTLTTETLAGGLQTIFQQQLLLSGGDPLEAYKQLVADFGSEPGKGGQFSIAGNVFNDPFGVILKSMQDAGLGSLIGAGFGEMQTGLAGITAENLISGAAGVEQDLGVSKDFLTTQLGKLSPEQLIQISDILAGGFEFKPVEGIGSKGFGAMPMEDQLALAGLPSELIALLKPEKTDEQKTRDTLDRLGSTLTGFKLTGVDPFVGAVEDFVAAVEKFATSGDTSTPRRNIVNTLGTHSQFDAMIAGNRTVTSGYRTWSLGSMSSDHAAGRAYDLVGQNLGLYQMAVRANGGYAEFHGGASGRHLHVVPNTNSAIGDTATPNMGGAVITTPSGNSTVVNMTINAAPGMDVNALASEVMARLERETKSRQERY